MRIDEKQRIERGNRVLQESINAFNKLRKGVLPTLKKQTAESLVKDASPEQRVLFMSLVDLS